jgi:hypothetical protein
MIAPSAHRRGFALAQVILASIVLSSISYMTVEMGRRLQKQSQSQARSAGLVTIANRIIPLQKDPYHWIQSLKAQPGYVADCLSPARICGSTAASPNATDDEINKIASGAQAVTTALADALGRPLAGTETLPLYYDTQGNPCVGVTNRNCKFSVVGYVIRHVPLKAGDPEAPQLVFRIAQNLKTRQLDEGLWQNRYEIIDADANWALNPGSLTTTCPDGQAVQTLFDSGKVLCAPVVPADNCPANQFLRGYDDTGQPVCQAFPTGAP